MAHVMVPVHVADEHWVAVVIDMLAKTITYMDSDTAAATSAVPAVARTTMGHLLRYLGDEHATQYDGAMLPAAWGRPDAIRGGSTSSSVGASLHDYAFSSQNFAKFCS